MEEYEEIERGTNSEGTTKERRGGGGGRRRKEKTGISD